MGLGPEDVVAFGDMPNDLAMLEWAGRGVAVANAHPDVLAAADEITLSHLDDGVAATLERLLHQRTVVPGGPGGLMGLSGGVVGGELVGGGELE
jgi:3-deoxy-D-manno-octulosonate 8-phosphate phosphatase KdsC-like HAD superfamily phosphatase